MDTRANLLDFLTNVIVAQDLMALIQLSVEVEMVFEAATTAVAAVSMSKNHRMVAVMSAQDQAAQQTVAFIDLRRMDPVELHQRLVCVSPCVLI